MKLEVSLVENLSNLSLFSGLLFSSPVCLPCRSTIAQPCNYSGWFDPNLAAEFGVVSIDWANHENSYRSRPYPNIPGGPVFPDNADLVTQAEMIKRASQNRTKVLPVFRAPREYLQCFALEFPPDWENA